MFRRVFCLLCAVLLLVSAVPASAEEAAGNHSYDFDLTFFLNAASFPELMRSRAAGYASLVNRLGLRGNLSWSDATRSMDLDAVLYLTDDPSLVFPFRVYGTKARVFVTSPMINNQTILLNMEALMEFALKAKNTLGIQLPYFALLVPNTYDFAMAGLVRAWQETIGVFTESGEVTPEQFNELSERWQDEFVNNGNLYFFVTGLATGSEAPSVVEQELNSLPLYYLSVTGDQPVQVDVVPGSQTWKNAAGDTLFSRQESEGSLSLRLALPASENGYAPSFSLTFQEDGSSFSFDAAAAVRLDAEAAGKHQGEETDSDGWDDESGWYGDEDDEDAYDESDWYSEDSEDKYDGYEWSGDEDGAYNEYGGSDDDGWETPAADLPELLLDLRVNGAGLPLDIPADSAFSLSASVLGAVYPNYSFCVNGETKKDGSLILSLTKPFSEGTVPVEILRCSGTLRPAVEPKEVPDYMKKSLETTHNVFSFNEQSLADFSATVIPQLIRSVISFLAAAPTASVQSFLDDLTDLGILDMLLNR